MKSKELQSQAYSWVPSLYFTEALPYAAVMILSTIMYKKMGLSNTDLALYTSWLYLPWVIKPLWSPIVDSLKTKRWWIISMQVLMGAGLAGLAFTLNTNLWLKLSLCFFWLMAFSSATHDIAADGFYILALDSHSQSFYVGIRSTFYRIATIFVQGLLVILAGQLEKHQGIPMAWSITFYVLAAIMLLMGLWHSKALPRPKTDKSALEAEEQETETDIDKSHLSQNGAAAASSKNLLLIEVKELWNTLKLFFSKPQILPALLFMLLFRFPEAQLVKIAQPFMLDGTSAGGLGLSTSEVGFIYGTIGIIGLTLGGILGGIAVSRGGLKKWMFPMVLSISLPDLVYVYLSYFQPTNLTLINSCVFIEQFGYGFGFTAYMLYLIYFAKGERSTAVYALCTAFMALGMMLPGMMAGWLADIMGYKHFFVWVVICCAITFIVSALLKIDPEFGKKNAKEEEQKD